MGVEAVQRNLMSTPKLASPLTVKIFPPQASVHLRLPGSEHCGQEVMLGLGAGLGQMVELLPPLGKRRGERDSILQRVFAVP